jgi:hypothetical protein
MQSRGLQPTIVRPSASSCPAGRRSGQDRARPSLRIATDFCRIGWLAWPSISWLKLAGTDVQRWKKAYPTVLQVGRAAQLIACGALVDVRVVEVVASFGGVTACRRI